MTIECKHCNSALVHITPSILASSKKPPFQSSCMMGQIQRPRTVSVVIADE